MKISTSAAVNPVNPAHIADIIRNWLSSRRQNVAARAEWSAKSEKSKPRSENATGAFVCRSLRAFSVYDESLEIRLTACFNACIYSKPIPIFRDLLSFKPA